MVKTMSAADSRGPPTMAFLPDTPMLCVCARSFMVTLPLAALRVSLAELVVPRRRMSPLREVTAMSLVVEMEPVAPRVKFVPVVKVARSACSAWFTVAFLTLATNAPGVWMAALVVRSLPAVMEKFFPLAAPFRVTLFTAVRLTESVARKLPEAERSRSSLLLTVKLRAEIGPARVTLVPAMLTSALLTAPLTTMLASPLRPREPAVVIVPSRMMGFRSGHAGITAEINDAAVARAEGSAGVEGGVLAAQALR